MKAETSPVSPAPRIPMAVPAPVPVLWTGGWDSTFRVLELVLHHEREVQPYYVIDTTRRSLAAEIRTMRNIRELLAERSPEAAARLLPTIYDELGELAPDPAMLERAEGIRAHIGQFGPQYEWLARFAEQRGVDGLELGVEWGPNWERMMAAGQARRVRTEVGVYTLVGGGSASPEFELWSRFRFPVFHLSKREMARIARERGFADLLEQTWFCNDPRAGGRACGTCRPCLHTREEGLGRRMPRRAHVRFVLYQARRAARAARRRLLWDRPTGASVAR